MASDDDDTREVTRTELESMITLSGVVHKRIKDGQFSEDVSDPNKFLAGVLLNEYNITRKVEDIGEAPEGSGPTPEDRPAFCPLGCAGPVHDPGFHLGIPPG